MKIKFNQKQVPEISEKIIKKLLKMDNKRARVLALSGELGAGKTTLTKELARKFGIKENIVSPTFVLMKFYEINSKSKYYSHFKKLIHIDAYRLDSHKDLLKIGWDELVSDKDNLIIIEWPERVEKCLKDGNCRIKLEHIDEETRSIEF
jgi:tRNA threonylcarbamoyladenosine biosynthesis protein TsaE